MYPINHNTNSTQAVNFQGAPTPTSNEKPKKFVTINGVMQKNPQYEKYMQSQGKTQDSGLSHQPAALAIVSNMEEHAAFSEASQQSGQGPRPLAPSMNATIDMMQEPEIAGAIGLDSDEMVDGLGAIFAKYEVPMGLMNKLMMLSDFNSLQFIVDNSGSMGQLSDTFRPNNTPQTRWQEVESRLISMLEILAYVPCAPIEIRFLNGNDKIRICHEPNQTPLAFLQEASAKIQKAFRNNPFGTTPAFEKLHQSIQEGQGQRIARYFFGDGEPNGGQTAITKIQELVKNRPNPAGNPITFLSCTNNDAEVEWMKELDETADFCAECDDYEDEKNEVLQDQGQAFPFSRGFYLVAQLVGAMNPDDLDAMDESVPFTKATLDNLLGVVQSPAEYEHYFQHFMQAQQARPISSPLDNIKKNQNWHQYFHEFLNKPVASQIGAVQAFQQTLKTASGNQSANQGFGLTPQYPHIQHSMNTQPAVNNGQFSQGLQPYVSQPMGSSQMNPQFNPNSGQINGTPQSQTGFNSFFNRHF